MTPLSQPRRAKIREANFLFVAKLDGTVGILNSANRLSDCDHRHRR